MMFYVFKKIRLTDAHEKGTACVILNTFEKFI